MEYETTSEISELIKQEWWSNFHGLDADPVHEPRLDTQRVQQLCPHVLTKGEVGRLITKLKFGKTAGLDTLPSDIFKIIKKIITPFLERLYGACLEQSYIPDQFKEARTLVVRKADKESYTIPSSFRPITLLSVMGKMLEALVAHRLRDLNLQFSLLPIAQYGVAGKCTTKAVRMILDPVYGAWRRGLKATLMRLDIKGAHDGVNRKQLLDILLAKGIPTWIIKFVSSFPAIFGIAFEQNIPDKKIRFVWSFLSDRSTTLDMQGHPSLPPCFVNIGIPQGSPLSPILFLFFASPMLDELQKSAGLRGDCIVVQYVDDIHILAVSESHEKNCQNLEVWHDEILAWARGCGVTFTPSRYGVMHFRGKNSTCLPNIPGLDRQKALKPSMRVLGVILDHGLKWEEHVDHVSATSQYSENMHVDGLRSLRVRRNRRVTFSVYPNQLGACH